MHQLGILWRYLKFLVRSTNEHGIHSPFVYQLLTEVIQEKSPYYTYQDIASIRAKLLLSKQSIEVSDLGAGSKVSGGKVRSISSITKTAVKPPKWGELMFRLCKHFQPTTVLELGTSLGLTTAYLAKAAPKASIISIEGCPNISRIARINLEKLEVENVEQINGSFETELKPTLGKLKKLDFAFIDGNHRKEATISYFEQCLPYCHEQSVLIFDDIYWSKEMEEVWQVIRNHPKVTISIDLFQLGMVFFKEDQERQHFTVRH